MCRIKRSRTVEHNLSVSKRGVDCETTATKSLADENWKGGFDVRV